MASQSSVLSPSDDYDDDVWMFSSTGTAGWGLRNIVLDNWTSSQGDNSSFIVHFFDDANPSYLFLFFFFDC